MELLLSVFGSEDFAEKLLLLLIGAIVTGVMVPLIKSRMDHAKFKNQKKFEAEMSRQATVINAQKKFLEELSDLAWDFQLRVMEVTYTRSFGTEETFTAVFEKYDIDSWGLLREIRSTIGTARWFVDDATYQLLSEYYHEWIVAIDSSMMGLVRSDASLQDWEEYHQFLYRETSVKTDELFGNLARRFSLIQRENPLPNNEVA